MNSNTSSNPQLSNNTQSLSPLDAAIASLTERAIRRGQEDISMEELREMAEHQLSKRSSGTLLA